jgi:hypothetical protein
MDLNKNCQLDEPKVWYLGLPQGGYPNFEALGVRKQTGEML